VLDLQDPWDTTGRPDPSVTLDNLDPWVKQDHLDHLGLRAQRVCQV